MQYEFVCPMCDKITLILEGMKVPSIRGFKLVCADCGSAELDRLYDEEMDKRLMEALTEEDIS